MSTKHRINLGILSILLLSIVIPTVVRAYFFNTPLHNGSSGEAVSALQQTLQNQNFFTFPQITGYFGPVTEKSVQDFQRSKGIVSFGTPATTGYGRVGPQTQAALNGATPQPAQTQKEF